MVVIELLCQGKVLIVIIYNKSRKKIVYFSYLKKKNSSDVKIHTLKMESFEVDGIVFYCYFKS